jgi:hypothetical protein
MKDSYYVSVNPETKRLYTLEERRDLGLITWAEYERLCFKQEWDEVVAAIKAPFVAMFKSFKQNDSRH